MTHNAQAQLLREHVEQAMRFLEQTMEGVTTELAHWRPPGIANPIGANYAHVVLGQDGAVNGGQAAFAIHAGSSRKRSPTLRGS